MSNIRELSQLASIINIVDQSKSIGIITEYPDAKVGIGTLVATSKVDVVGDVNVSGAITATNFYGDGSNLTGIVVGVGTEDSINTTGIITASSFYGDGSNLSGIATFSGDYDDLINKPSIPSIVGLASEGYVNNLVAISTFSGDYDDLINKPSIPSLVGYATEGYVDSSITNLIDSAPGALDTLNELAAALGDDSNFSATVTNSLASKANLSGANFTGVVTATSFYGDGSNLSNIISGVGIQSAGNVIGTGITTLNFIGAGNTFAINGTTVDISIAGGGSGGGASVSISTEAPSNPSEGDLWYNSVLGRTFIYYSDDSSSQWVDSAPFNPTEPPSTPGKSSYTLTATEGQTEFTVSYTAGYIDVFLNGIRLNSSEYAASNGSSITLVQEATAGDVLDVVEYRMGIGATGAPGAPGTNGVDGVDGIDGAPGAGGPLSNVTVTTDNSTFYPVVTTGTGSTLPYITTTSNYFEFTPASGTLKTNQLVISGVATATAFYGDGSGLTGISGAGSTVFNDTTTNQEFYLTFTDTTSGTITSTGISTSKLTYNPFSGEVTAVDYNSTSDRNLKQNIEIIENPIDKVSNINGVTFDWKSCQQSSAGVIAQDVEKVLPEIVKESEDGFKSVSYNGLIGLLVEVVKEQQEQINTLTKRIEVLEGN